MAEETAFENGRISNFKVLLNLTLDQVIMHTVVHHSSTSTYMPNFIEIKETFCGRTDTRMYARMDIWRVDLKIQKWPKNTEICWLKIVSYPTGM